ncbi:MAG: ATP-binding protein [Acidobacteria bacterium]|nr:ATP-binding protein [Acidobacteriota bacterium]
MFEEPIRISMSLPSRPEYLDLVQDVVVSVARLCGFAEDGQMDIGLAMREGAVNAMKHGNKLDPRLPIEVEITGSIERITMTIRDRGTGFDPASVPDPTLPENILKSSGRGLFLIHTLVDEVRFHPRSPGTELVLVKRRPALAAGASA